MVFLIEYDRRAGRLVSLTEFEDSDRAAAEDARLARELVLNHTRTNREVVLLQARDLDALKRTHKRYFATLKELIADLASAVASHGEY